MSENIKCCRVEIDTNIIETGKKLLNKKNRLISSKSKIFALLGNDVRLKIMTLFINYKRLCVCDLSDILNMNQSPISQHLRKLKDGELLENKREGMTIFYFIPDEIFDNMQQIIEG